MNNRHLIKSVTPGSIAEEMEIEAGGLPIRSKWYNNS